MPRLLIVFATTHGHTAKIAARIAKAARGEGIRVDVREVEGVGEVELADFDAVLAGGSIHGGRHQNAIVEWAAEHREQLGDRPAAFFSVSLTAAERGEEAQRATAGYLEDFAERTGWSSDGAQAFAGALQYREYDMFTRVLMLLLMRVGDHPTDTRHDYDYTDWAAVERFGREFAARMLARA
jgi:menaquinone-dependent protoporphyrinogen oxidase